MSLPNKPGYWAWWQIDNYGFEHVGMAKIDFVAQDFGWPIGNDKYLGFYSSQRPNSYFKNDKVIWLYIEKPMENNNV